MHPRPYRLLVFDWDGTLIDSIESIVGCTRAVLAELDLPRLTDERIRAGIGMGIREAVENLVPGYDEELFERILGAYRRHWLDTYGGSSELFEGVAEMLERLHAEGYLMAVATAKGREGLDRELERTGVGRLFAASRTVSESPGKPHPAMLHEILRETGSEPGEALVIGDSVHDMGMAVNAGVEALGVATGTERCATLIAAGALDCLERAIELGDWLERRAAVAASAPGPPA